MPRIRRVFIFTFPTNTSLEKKSARREGGLIILWYFSSFEKRHFLDLKISNNKPLKLNIMAKGKDTKKAVKKEPLKSPKEKKAEKREKKLKRG